MKALLRDLNEEQLACVLHDAEVLQVLAGPGSGKTRVLTVRIALAIAQRLIAPEHIIVVTFTNKAARELKERLANLVGEQIVRRLIVGTFHSVSLRYLQRYGTNIGLDKKILVADSSESRNIISKTLKVLRKQSGSRTGSDETQMTPGAALSHISKLKSNGLSVQMSRDVAGTKAFPLSLGETARNELLQVYEAYQNHLDQHNLLDFDDLILKALELFKICPDVVGTIRHVFVDEFQDTSSQQFDLMQMLAQRNRNITIVGDHDQSIYGFRAADIKNFERMHAIYDNCVEFHLKQNYRSTGAIVFAASALIEQDSARPSKDLETANILGTQPTLRVLSNAKNEADWLAKEITRLLANTAGLLKPKDIAVLVRSASLTLPIEQALQRHKLNYKLSNARKFLERPHIRPLVNYLRVVQSETSLALLEVVNIPPRKFGQTSVENLQAESSKIRRSLWQTLKAVSRGSIVLCKKKDNQLEKALGRLVRTVERCRKMLVNDNDMSMTDMLNIIITDIEYEKYLKSQYPEDYGDRLEDVQEFLQTSDVLGEKQEEDQLPSIDGLEANELNQTSLDRLCSALSLMSDSGGNGEQDASDCLTISTIHSAKGLEWPVVFIPGVYHGSIPSARAAFEEQDEERRLLYVAMTRAKALLYLSYPEKTIRHESVSLSSFLSHRKLMPLLDSRGPRITLHVLKELASVLQLPQPDVADFEISEDSYEDKTLEYLADEEYRMAAVTARVVKRRIDLVPSEVPNPGFSTASTVLASMPVDEIVNRRAESTDKKQKKVSKSSGQSNIKAFFNPQPQLKRQTSAPAGTAVPVTSPVDMEDYRVVVLSSSPEREAPIQLWRSQTAPIVTQRQVHRQDEYICTKERNYHTASATLNIASKAPVKKRLGMSRPRIVKS